MILMLPQAVGRRMVCMHHATSNGRVDVVMMVAWRSCQLVVRAVRVGETVMTVNSSQQLLFEG